MYKPNQTITICLWFDGQAEEAVKFYTSIFDNSRTTAIMRNTESAPGETGSVLTVEFEAAGQSFLALNGGPEFKFTPAMSIVVNCESQSQVDDYWDKLLAGGGTVMECGWLTDKFGVSWQVAPIRLTEMLLDEDRGRADQVMKAMMKMKKLDLAKLEEAYRQPVGV